MSNRDPIKVYDARWEEGDFSDGEVSRLFEAVLLYGRELGVDTVTIARDARTGAGRVMELALELGVRAGLRVFACAEPISTPHSYFLSLATARNHPQTLGLTITASHNPASYLGLKITVPILQAVGLDSGPKGGLARVRDLYHGQEALPERSGGSLHFLNLSEEYLRFSMEAASVAEGELGGLEVVLDAMNGSAGPEVHKALELCGARVRPLRIVPDGRYPTGSPNPTSAGKMDRAVALAGATGAVAVIGTDGDGDRLVFGDGRGILSAGFVFIPVLRSARQQADSSFESDGRVLYGPKVNPLALSEWRKLGVRPALFRNGHSQIKERMRRLDCIAAVEESGHYYHRVRYGDLTAYCENSLLTILLWLKSRRVDPQLCDRLWALQRRVFTTGELNFQLDDDRNRDLALAKLLELFQKDGAVLTSQTPDGVDLQGTVVARGVPPNASAPRGGSPWYSGYLRVATNEGAVLRVYLSAADEHTGRRLEEQMRGILESRAARQID
jgi:phosphomannomutase